MNTATTTVSAIAAVPQATRARPAALAGRWSAWAVPLAWLALAYGVVPLVATDYWFDAILMPFLALSLAAVGLNLLTGYAGQLSLGSAAFMAVGAFAALGDPMPAPGRWRLWRGSWRPSGGVFPGRRSWCGRGCGAA